MRRSFVAAALVMGAPAFADDTITVTATRLPEPALDVPAAIGVIGGDGLRARGAIDLRDVLSESAGVQVNPGGDAGPAGSVIAFQGLSELDAYLLVVDGVPYGGAFNPATPVLDLIDVERVEVLKGAAPVTFGPTSFVGVVHAIRYDAGEQPTRLLLQGGTQGSGRGSFATTVGPGQSLLASAESRDFTQDRSGFQRYHLLCRAAVDTGIGRVHADLEGTSLDERPYSPHPVEDGGLSARFPRDANVNPLDGRQDQDRVQANLGLDTTLGGLDWSTLASVAHSWFRNTRGFLRPDFADDGVTHNADGFRQRVETTDVYLDTHLGRKGDSIDWVIGADLLYGRGRERSANFEYGVLPDGSNAPRSTTLPIDESTVLVDRRSFAGLYGQVVARPVAGLTLLGGLRLDRTVERRCGGQEDGDSRPDADDCQRRAKTRLSGSVGGSYALLSGDSAVSLFGDYRRTYKPAAIDFGPEAEGDILQPESTRSWEAGIKASFAGGRITAEANWFDTRFRNLVIAENVDGFPGLANAGRSRLRGLEAELHAAISPAATITATYAHHLARFTDYAQEQDDGTLLQLGGKRLELSPKDLAAVIATYAPTTGPQAALTVRYTGAQFLDKENTAATPAYVDVDARAGWRWSNGWGAFVDARNLTNRRDPVALSELGDGQVYRLPGRRVLVTFELRR